MSAHHVGSHLSPWSELMPSTEWTGGLVPFWASGDLSRHSEKSKQKKDTSTSGKKVSQSQGPGLASSFLLQHLSFRDCRAQRCTMLLWVIPCKYSPALLGLRHTKLYPSVYRDMSISPASLYQNRSHKAPGSGPAFSILYELSTYAAAKPPPACSSQSSPSTLQIPGP